MHDTRVLHRNACGFPTVLQILLEIGYVVIAAPILGFYRDYWILENYLIGQHPELHVQLTWSIRYRVYKGDPEVIKPRSGILVKLCSNLVSVSMLYGALCSLQCHYFTGSGGFSNLSMEITLVTIIDVSAA